MGCPRLLFLEPCARDFGGFFRANALARALAAEGCQVKLAIPSERWSWARAHSTPYPGVHLVEHPEIPVRRPFGKLARIPLVAAEMLASRADLIHVFGSVHPENFTALLLGKLARKPLVVDWDDYWQDSPAFLGSGKLFRSYIRFSEDQGTRLGLGVTAASAFLEEKARELGVSATALVPNGVWRGQFETVPRDRARAELGLAADALVVLAFGNTYLQGRGRLLLETFGELLLREPGCVLLTNQEPSWIWKLDGTGGPLPPELERVKCVGQIPQHRLGLYLGAADFVVFLSDDRPSERASYPIRLGSYLNGECPIVTNQSETEAGRLVRRFGCGLVAKTPSEAARAMLEARRDPSAYRRMVEGARAGKEALDYGRIARDLLGFYGRILGSRAST